MLPPRVEGSCEVFQDSQVSMLDVVVSSHSCQRSPGHVGGIWSEDMEARADTPRHCLPCGDVGWDHELLLFHSFFSASSVTDGDQRSYVDCSESLGSNAGLHLLAVKHTILKSS